MSDKVAVVTGAGSGIGNAIARTLLKTGMRVAGVDIVEQGLADLAKEANETYGSNRVLPTVADVSSQADCERAARSVFDAFKRVDILVNSAGVGAVYARPDGFQGVMRFWESDPVKWQRQIAINNNGPFLMSRCVVEDMIARGWGRIINISTGFATMLSSGRGGYGPAKAGLEANTLIWSKDLAGTGVTVNALLPGGTTATGLKGGLDTGLPGSGQPLLSTTIFEAPTLWLASSASDGVTGYRFIAKDWDTALSPDEAAARCRTPAAWPGLAGKA